MTSAPVVLPASALSNLSSARMVASSLACGSATGDCHSRKGERPWPLTRRQMPHGRSSSIPVLTRPSIVKL